MIVAQDGTNVKNMKETAITTMNVLEIWFVAVTIVVIHSILVMIVAPSLLQDQQVRFKKIYA